MLERQLKDQLPGGKYANASDNIKKESLSTLKHNKLPEFLFGQLDYIVRCRPNASILANEALILYSFNKTSNWLNGLSETERDTVLKDSMEQRRVLYEKFSERKKEIQQTKKKKYEEKERIIKEKEQCALERKEKLTSDICYYRLWQSLEDIDKFLSEISTEKEKKTALKAKLNFRKKVLKQHSPEKDIYLFSYVLDGKTKQCSAQQLAGKLKTLVLASHNIPPPEHQDENTDALCLWTEKFSTLSMMENIVAGLSRLFQDFLNGSMSSMKVMKPYTHTSCMMTMHLEILE